MTEHPQAASALLPQQEYFAHLADGRFMIQRSRSSGEYVFYPRVAAPRTGAQDLSGWRPRAGARSMPPRSCGCARRPRLTTSAWSNSRKARA